MDRNIIHFIKESWDCITYAQTVLGLPIYKDGDRCVSPLRSDADNPTSFVVYHNYWCDYGADLHGDVIDLCALAKHNGDISAALRELAGDHFKNIGSEWERFTKELDDMIDYWHSQLRPEDIEYLHSRRISDDTINRLKIGFCENRNRLMIPYFKNGHVAYFIGRDRSGNPKAAKYTKAALNEYNDNIPWGLHTLTKSFDELFPEFAQDSKGKNIKRKDWLCILEGMFDVMSFEQNGFHVLSPISGYFNKQQKPIVITAAKKHENVFVCFDSDAAGTRFTQNMCKDLFSNRIRFRVGYLPHGIKDVSDFYAAGGNITDLITDSEDGLFALAKSFTKQEDFANFLRDASRFVYKTEIFSLCELATQFPAEWRKFLLADCTNAPRESIIVNDITKSYDIAYHIGLGFYEYSHGVWKLTPEEFIKRYVDEKLGLYSTSARQSSICNFLQNRTSTQEAFDKMHIFNFINGILELDTGELKPHDKTFMSSHQVTYAYDKKANCPKFLKFLNQAMVGDQKKIDLLQEMAGYIFFPDCRHEKAFCLIGDGANGKSVLINTLSSVFGEDNCSNVSISDLMGPFDPIRLQHSIANFSTEMKSNIKGAEDKFKQVISGETISAAYKGKDAIQFKPRGKWIFSANNYMSSNDVSYGFTRRLIFIKFPKVFKGEEVDKKLTAKLFPEIPGIFNWCYEGYLRLMENEDFTETDESKELKKEFLSGINPCVVFCEEVLEPIIYEPHYNTGTMYAKYAEWCKNNGNQALSRINFVRNIRTILAKQRPDVRYVKSSGETYFVFNMRTVEDAVK